MLQTVKSSFLILVIFTMSSAVYAADNNGGTKQPETKIYKAGIEVKVHVFMMVSPHSGRWMHRVSQLKKSRDQTCL